MKPTQEQLNDPKWWDENAPEGAEAWVDERFVKWISGKEYDFTFEKWLVSEKPWSLDDYKNDSRFTVVERPTKPAFVPEVGVECEFNHPDFGWTGCTPIGLFRGYMVCAPDSGGFYQGSNLLFRTTKSKRELFLDLVKKELPKADTDDLIFAGKLYDSGLFCLKEADK